MKLLWLAPLVLLGAAAYIRLAPSDPARWHVSPSEEAGPGSAALHIPGDGPALLARLAPIAEATPRTRRLAGSAEEGRITWITRSAFWSFPDYTTAEARPDGLHLYARLRFGRSDFGVNAQRLAAWRAALSD